MGFNSAFKGLKLLKKIPRERAFKQFKWPRPQCVKTLNMFVGTVNTSMERIILSTETERNVLLKNVRKVEST